jgi:lipopolysaccharide biosynthesis protein
MAEVRWRTDTPVAALAFYLPQFHPIPENDAWWGPGFTEWTNVTRARPLFPGHYQPHLPADLGFYDLRLPEVREGQAALAREYGLSGFCYYHYWFDGRRLLERPFEEVLASGHPDFPFCLCWANEPWSRRWDGSPHEVLMPQRHSLEDDRRHMAYLARAFADPRYLRIDGRALFLVWRTELFPDPAATAAVWREVARAEGAGEIFLARVEGHAKGVDPASIGFDAAVEFAPDWRITQPRYYHREKWDIVARMLNQLRKAGLLSEAYRDHRVSSYDDLAAGMLAKPHPGYRWFRCATPGWDNSPRRAARQAHIWVDATPERYGAWLRALVEETARRPVASERLVFVNAWNEWAEGNYLEPDQGWGRAFLEATRRALGTGRPSAAPAERG